MKISKVLLGSHVPLNTSGLTYVPQPNENCHCC
jgi:hypothetical protein